MGGAVGGLRRSTDARPMGDTDLCADLTAAIEGGLMRVEETFTRSDGRFISQCARDTPGPIHAMAKVLRDDPGATAVCQWLPLPSGFDLEWLEGKQGRRDRPRRLTLADDEVRGLAMIAAQLVAFDGRGLPVIRLTKHERALFMHLLQSIELHECDRQDSNPDSSSWALGRPHHRTGEHG